MNVIQINSVNGLKSTGRTAHELAEYLNNNGHIGYVAYARGLPYKKGYKIGSSFDHKLHGLFSRMFGLQAYFSIGSTYKLINYLNNIKPDVVHLRNLHSNYINIKILLKYLAETNMPTVLTLHDCWFFTGKCTYYTVDTCYKWQKECNNCPRLKKDNPSWLFDQTQKMYNDKKKLFKNIPRLAVVGVSDWILNEAKKSYLSSASIMTRIYNWIDFDIFKPVDTKVFRKNLGLEDKFIILGVASTWKASKGLKKFINLSEQISKDMQIILIGTMSQNIHLPENILHIDEINNANELVKYYSMADVLVNMSIEETFGKVTAEALACGTPAIVFNSTANPELIGNNCGYVVKVDKLYEIVQYINVVKSFGKYKYSKYCIEQANRYFSKEKNIQKYIDLYYNIIR